MQVPRRGSDQTRQLTEAETSPASQTCKGHSLPAEPPAAVQCAQVPSSVSCHSCWMGFGDAAVFETFLLLQMPATPALEGNQGLRLADP
ncbi:hypothetical protein LEMLEM_LOCUS25365 [Lemmus lemmus]